MSKRRLVDTNILVRIFSGSPPKAAARARELLVKAEAGQLQLVILPIVVAETIYTLQSFYGVSKSDVCTKLQFFLSSKGIVTHEYDIIFDALDRYMKTGVHFVDAYLAAMAAHHGMPIHSFDSDFARFKDVEWLG